MPDIREIAIIAEYEGLTIEEAKLVFAERKDLPATVFCGPFKSFPACDAKNTRESLSKLLKFGSKIPKAIALKIYRRLVEKTKKFGVEHDSSKFKWLTGEIIEETADEVDERDKKLLAWLDEIYDFKKKR